MKIDLISSNPLLRVLGCGVEGPDSTTAKVEISKTETHAVSEFAPIYVAGAGVPRLEQTKPKLNRTEQKGL